MFVHALPFLVSLSFLPIAALGVAYGGLWSYGGIVYAFLIIPVVDYLMGVTKSNLDPKTEERALIFHRAITWMWVPIQIGLIFTVIAFAGANPDPEKNYVVTMIAIGLLTGGIGITYAHELMHQTNKFERSLSEILMTSTLYGHFCIEHVHGHHIHVGTPKDPVSARYGESIYKFYPRAVFGSLASAWRIQRDRMARRNQSFWGLSNPFWRYLLAYVAYFATAYALAGWFGVGLFALQAFVAFTLLEIINYVEHYGLRRRQLADGRYERVQPRHSWNASHQFTNYLLINLQRHSDHHKHPQRRYPVLQHYDEDEAPQLPYGYPTMLIMSLVPPVWFRVMNPRVEAWRRRHYPEEVAA
ncbi:MAG: alkane 1-monooxygenase [Hyphomicrobiales bacterium]|nr:alkane 1-monooxygenase [Hyphomicrobiales bacterium]